MPRAETAGPVVIDWRRIHVSTGQRGWRVWADDVLHDAPHALLQPARTRSCNSLGRYRRVVVLR